MLQWFKTAYQWLVDKWTSFEAWVYEWMPGFKTKLIAFIGIVGNAAVVLQDYITQVPLNKFVNETQLAVIGIVLFTLAFWFKRLSDNYSSPLPTSPSAP
jgi:hypothetical protein